MSRKEPDWEKGFLRLVKTLNEIIYFGLDITDNNAYICKESRSKFWNLEMELWEEWFYFGLVKDPYQKLTELIEKYKLNQAFQLAVERLNGEQGDNKLSL